MRSCWLLCTSLLALGLTRPATADIVYLRPDAKGLGALQRAIKDMNEDPGPPRRPVAGLHVVPMRRTVRVGPGRTAERPVRMVVLRCRILEVLAGNPASTSIDRKRWTGGGWAPLTVPPREAVRLRVEPLGRVPGNGRADRRVGWVGKTAWISLDDVDAITHEVDSPADIYAMLGNHSLLEAYRRRADPSAIRWICDAEDATWRDTFRKAISGAFAGADGGPALDDGWVVRFVRDGDLRPRGSSVLGLRDAPRGPTGRAGHSACGAGEAVRSLLTAAALDRAGFASQGLALDGVPPGEPALGRLVHQAARVLCGLDRSAWTGGPDPRGARDRLDGVGRSARAGALGLLDRAREHDPQPPGRDGGWLPGLAWARGADLGPLAVDPSLVASQALELIEAALAAWPEDEQSALVDALVRVARPLPSAHPRRSDELRRAADGAPELGLVAEARDLLVTLTRASPEARAWVTRGLSEAPTPEERSLCLAVLARVGFGSLDVVGEAIDELFRTALARPFDATQRASFVGDPARRSALAEDLAKRQRDRRVDAVATLAVLADLAEAGATDEEQQIGRAVLERMHEVFQSQAEGWGGKRHEAFFSAVALLSPRTPGKALEIEPSAQQARFVAARQRLAETFGGWLQQRLKTVREQLAAAKGDPTATDQVEALQAQAQALQQALSSLQGNGT